MAGVYYENVPVTVAVPSASARVLVLPYPDRVRLVKLNVVQDESTAAVLFRVDLYNRLVADAASATRSDYNWLITNPAGIPADAAGRLNFRFTDYDVYFKNQDDPVYVQVRGVNTPSLTDPLKRRRIYVRVTNTGGNAAIFNVILGSEAFEL